MAHGSRLQATLAARGSVNVAVFNSDGGYAMTGATSLGEVVESTS